ncbi:MAG: PaaI family thioesterase [Alphaproteobacteria bacterium]|nr:PaaI family thioesterase [Alphaproteobacteria bacterium]
MTNLLSPYARTMGFEAERDSEGRLVIAMPYGDGVRGRPGFVHGGALAGLLETVAYVTLSEALGAEDKPVLKPVNMTATYMRGALEVTTYARATIERLGKRIANIEAVAWQDDPAKPVAIAQINVMLDRSGR